MGGGREIYIANNSTVNICLNGHELKAYIVPGENAVLNICDCKGGGRITNPDAHVIAFRKNNGTVNIYGGTLEASVSNTIIDFGSGGALKDNVLNLYGGTVNYGGETVNTAIGSRTLTVNLYGGEINTTASNGIVVQNGKLNLCGNTVINVQANYDSIKVYGKEIIDAKGYTGGNVSILCSGLSDGDTVVKNVTDKTEGKFSLSAGDSDHILVREGSDLVLKALYTVAFLPNGGSGTMDPDRVSGGEYSLPDNLFTAPEGKKFKAWNVNGKEYNPEDVITVTSDTTVTAVWENKVKTPVQISEGPQRYEYDSGAKSFKITAANVSGGFSVSYEKDGIEFVLPTGAGSYDVIIKRAADDFYAEYDKRIPGGLVIDPMDITGIAIVGAFGDMTYTGNAQTPVATVTAKNLHVTGAWSEVTNVSDKTTFTATGNFTGTVSDMGTNMKKADSDISFAPITLKDLYYNKNAQVLITAGGAVGGTLKYSIDNKATWSKELPKGTDAGEYYVWFKVFVDENHNDTYTNGLRVTIAKASVAIPTVPGKVYTGGTLTADITDGEHYTVSENNGGTEVGRYDVKLKLRDDANYYWESKEKDVSVITVDFNISAAENKWTAEPSMTGWTYGENANAPVYGAKFGDVKIEYKKASEPDSDYTIAVPANAGDYNVRLSVAATDNFGGLTKALDFTIAKASQSAPASVAAVNETIRGKKDGKITGTDSTMEYKADGATDYTAVSENEILNLVPGTYLVRYKENDNYLAGEDKVIVIAAGEMITVSFDTMGGSAVEAKTCEYNGKISAPEEPTKEGYAFIGWFSDSALTEKWDFASGVLSENKTLYAAWVQGTVATGEDNVENVTANGLNDIAKSEKTDISLVVKALEDSKDSEGQKAIKSISGVPNHLGFYDIELLKKSTGEAITEAPNTIEIRLPYNFYKKKSIKVYRYHAGSAEELSELNERAAAPYEDGKCFVDTDNGYIYIYSSKFSTYSVGYNKVSSGTGNSKGGGGGTAVSYTVSFETNGAGELESLSVSKNGVIKEPKTPAKEGFEFASWFTDKALKTKYDFSEKVTKSFTLYAAWEEKDDSLRQIILTVGRKEALVFGKTKSNDVAPVIRNDRTMLPARFVAENLGATVTWDEEKRLVTITGNGVTILLTIGEETAMVNGKEVKIDSPAFIENDRTYTPIRFIAEELGATVKWIEAEQKVVITK